MGIEHSLLVHFLTSEHFRKETENKKYKIIKKTLITVAWLFARSTSPNVAPALDSRWEQWGWAF